MEMTDPFSTDPSPEAEIKRLRARVEKIEAVLKTATKTGQALKYGPLHMTERLSALEAENVNLRAVVEAAGNVLTAKKNYDADWSKENDDTLDEALTALSKALKKVES